MTLISGKNFLNIDWKYSLNDSLRPYSINRNTYTFKIETDIDSEKLYFYMDLQPNTTYTLPIKYKVFDNYKNYSSENKYNDFTIAPTNYKHLSSLYSSSNNNNDFKNDPGIYSYTNFDMSKGEHDYKIKFTTKNEGRCIFVYNFSDFYDFQNIQFSLTLGSDFDYKLPYTTQSLSLMNYSDNKTQPWIYQENYYSNSPKKENVYSKNENSSVAIQHKKLIGGYEHLYRKISYLDPSKTYKLSFKYKITFVDKQGKPITDSGNPYLSLLPDSHNFNNYGYFNGFYRSPDLKENTTDYQTFVAEFNPTSSTIYPSFEFGALRDDNYIDVKIYEFKIEESHKIQRQISLPADQVWFTNYDNGFSYKNTISESGAYNVDLTQYMSNANWEKNYTILNLKPYTEYVITGIFKYDYNGGHVYFNVYGEKLAKSKMLGEFNRNYGGDNVTASEFGGLELSRNDSYQKTLKFTTKDEGTIYLFLSYANLNDFSTLKFSVQNLQITELTSDPSHGKIEINKNIKQTDNLIIYKDQHVNSLYRKNKIYRLTLKIEDISNLGSPHFGNYLKSYSYFPPGTMDVTNQDVIVLNKMWIRRPEFPDSFSNDTEITFDSSSLRGSISIDDYNGGGGRPNNYLPEVSYRQYQLISSVDRRNLYQKYTKEQLAQAFKSILDDRGMTEKYETKFIKRFDFVGYKGNKSSVITRYCVSSKDESLGYCKFVSLPSLVVIQKLKTLFPDVK